MGHRGKWKIFTGRCQGKQRNYIQGNLKEMKNIIDTGESLKILLQNGTISEAKRWLGIFHLFEKYASAFWKPQTQDHSEIPLIITKWFVTFGLKHKNAHHCANSVGVTGRNHIDYDPLLINPRANKTSTKDKNRVVNLLYLVCAGCRCFYGCLIGHLLHTQAQSLLASWTAVGCLICLGFLHDALRQKKNQNAYIKTRNGLIIGNGLSCQSQSRKKS